MRKLFLIILIFLLIPISGCTNSSDKYTVKTQLYVLKFLVDQIAGSKVETSLISNSGNAHDNEMTQAEVADLSQADAVYYIGIGDLGQDFENTSQVLKPSAAVDASSKIKTGDNPHVWLSLPMMSDMAQTIFDDLSRRLPSSKDVFQTNLTKLQEKLTTQYKKYQQMFQAKKGKALLVEHPAYEYFAKDFSLQEIPLVSGGENADISIKDIEAIKENVDKLNISTIFADQSHSSKIVPVVSQTLNLNVIKISTLEVVSNADQELSYFTLYDKLVNDIYQNI